MRKRNARKGTSVSSSTSVAALFPSSIAAGTAVRQRRLHRAGTIAMALVVVGGLVAVGLVLAARRSTSQGYRISTVTQQPVATQLNGVAVIEPVRQAEVSFPISGTVSSVEVAPGAIVKAGQPLATLDTTSLMANLHQAQQTLAAAQLTLQQGLDGTAAPAGSGSSAQQIAYRSGDAATAILLADKQPSPPGDLTAAINAVLAAQQKVDSARADAATALSSAKTICAAVGSGSGGSTGGGGGSTGGGGGSTGGGGDTGTITACQTALDNVLAAQTTVNDAQTTLANASTALDALLQKMAQNPPTTTPTTTPGSPTTNPTNPQHHPTTTTTTPTGNGSKTTGPKTPHKGGSTTPTTTPTSTPPTSTGQRSGSGAHLGGGGGSGGGGGGTSHASGGSGVTSRAPTAEDLASYQSAVDDATAQVTVAQQAIAQATIVSPIAGTVVAVNFATGDQASAGSTTQTIIIQGAGGYEATTTVSVNDIAQVKVGQAATLMPDGSRAGVSGKVVSVSAMPTSTTSATTSYGVIVSLPATATGLGNGAIGSLAITTGSTKSALAVPTSAVTTNGNLHTVTVVEGSTTRQVTVRVGVVGPVYTQITSGLSAGQQVVLANLDSPLPDSATSTPANGAAGNGAGGGLGAILRANGFNPGAVTRTRTSG
jgi:HlyD family secretion protein